MKASVNAARPAKSKLVATGFFDTGSKVVDLTHAATLEIGDIVIAVPGLTPDGKGKKFTYSAGGVTFLIVPNPNGSSRAKFRLIRTGDLTGHVALNGELRLRFTNDVVDGICRVQLGAGSFRLGSKRGALVAPNLFVVRARATLRGAGNDELSLIVGLATGGVTPGAAPEVAVSFGPVLSATITSGQFTNQGDVFTFKGNVGGVTGVVLDYAREQMSVTAKSADLGAFVEGPNPLTIVVGLGSDSRSVAVRAAKKGATLKY